MGEDGGTEDLSLAQGHNANLWPFLRWLFPLAGPLWGRLCLFMEVKGVPFKHFPPAPAFEELQWGRENVSSVASHVCGTQFVMNIK